MQSRVCNTIFFLSIWMAIAISGIEPQQPTSTVKAPLSNLISNNIQSSSTKPVPRPQPAAAKYHLCEDGRMFRFLTVCMKSCNGTVKPADDDQAKTKKTDPKPSTYSYKLVVLDKDEFKTFPNGTLATQLPRDMRFKKRVYTLANDKAYLCYAMPPEFVSCLKLMWGPEEYERKHEYRRLWVPSHKKHYEINEYALKWSDPQGAHFCQVEPHKGRNTALLTAWFLSLICLGLTIILSQVFPQLNLKNNKILLCNFGMLFLAYIILCVKLLLPKLSPGVCRFMGHLQQYTFLSAFCWINIQAIDVFLRFVNIRIQHPDSLLEKKRFIIYAVHAWLTPLWITLITLMVEEFDSQGNVNPGIKEECWLRKRFVGVAFLFFYGPISIILLINFILFGITVFKLCTLAKGSTTLKTGVKQQLLQVYMKLIVVMGLCWIMEVASVASGGDEMHWTFPDMINALQGVLIFIVYVCKRIFMKRIFNFVCRSPKCPKCWPLKPVAYIPGTTAGGEMTCSTNSTGGTLPRSSQNINRL